MRYELRRCGLYWRVAVDGRRVALIRGLSLALHRLASLIKEPPHRDCTGS